MDAMKLMEVDFERILAFEVLTRELCAALDAEALESSHRETMASQVAASYPQPPRTVSGEAEVSHA
jgi:hypothetical protein